MNDHYLTPKPLIDEFISAMGKPISTDPCWHPRSFTNPERAFTINSRFVNGRNVFFDGLFPELWIGDTIWINPPYSRPGPFVKAAIKYITINKKARIGLLLNSTTETKAFNEARRACRYRIEFLHRLAFTDANTLLLNVQNQYAQTLFLLGNVRRKQAVGTFKNSVTSLPPIKC